LILRARDAFAFTIHGNPPSGLDNSLSGLDPSGSDIVIHRRHRLPLHHLLRQRPNRPSALTSVLQAVALALCARVGAQLSVW